VPYRASRASSYHILPVILPDGADRQVVVDRMRDAGIQTSVHYPPVHRFSWYRSQFPSVHLPQTEEFCRRELTLPLHPKMEEWQVDYVARALAKALTTRPDACDPVVDIVETV
jgi:dTDP-4-amino-4,6-dideoxygalactose transaminase